MRRYQVLSIDVVIHRAIVKNNQITLFPCLYFSFAQFTFIGKTGVTFYFLPVSFLWGVQLPQNRMFFLVEALFSRAMDVLSNNFVLRRP